ncbi:MAG: type II toxin-antitoxin system RelE/ParE family toxin [Lachnospiraceae bacterium]|nr:type II toxin-antitoxin system RelE/ParE family toxin [Lachnospiraceae bacterium]
MKTYRVIVTPDAEADLKKYLAYLRDVKKNPQAVKSVLEDFKDTKNELKSVAQSLPGPDSEKLKARGLKRINFKKHNYFLLYYIDPIDTVYITDVFHGLESFEDKLK